ncbi:conserved hypothetical protein [delta proteobacterium NaphS2]|nr:conserved hypothetical protein [delta proteobacterium NaphS2]
MKWLQPWNKFKTVWQNWRRHLNLTENFTKTWGFGLSHLGPEPQTGYPLAIKLPSNPFLEGILLKFME